MHRPIRFTLRSLFAFSAVVMLTFVAFHMLLGDATPITKGEVLESIPRIRKVGTSLGMMHGVRIGDSITIVSKSHRFTGSVTDVRDDISIVKINALSLNEFPVAGDVVEFVAPARTAYNH